MCRTESAAARATGNTYWYRGQVRDGGTGNYQLGVRTYDPGKAAFTTPDSYRVSSSATDLSVSVDPLTSNTYTYVNGNPINLSDPDGHKPWCGGDDCPATSTAAAPEPVVGSAAESAANPAGLSFSGDWGGTVKASGGGSPLDRGIGAVVRGFDNLAERLVADAEGKSPAEIREEAVWGVFAEVAGLVDTVVNGVQDRRLDERIVHSNLRGGLLGFAEKYAGLDRGSIYVAMGGLASLLIPIPGAAAVKGVSMLGRALRTADRAGAAAKTVRAVETTAIVERTLIRAGSRTRATPALRTGDQLAAKSVPSSGIRFSQRSVGDDVAEIEASMRSNGWVGDPIDVVRMPDGGLTSLDNTRLLAAKRAGIDVQANVRGFDDLISESRAVYVRSRQGAVPTTWGEAITFRIGRQGAIYRDRYPNGSPFTGSEN